MSRTYRRHVQPSDFRDKADVRPYDRASARREADRERAEAMGELSPPAPALQLRRVLRGEQR